MRGEDHLPVIAEQRLGHVGRSDLIQSLGRFIGYDCGRGEAQRGSDRQQMPFLAIQGGSGFLRDRCQVEMSEQIADDRLTFAFRNLMFFQRLVDRLAY